MTRVEQQSFYSRGKLLISGEYLVLCGALALAVPVRFGQKMIVKKMQGSGIVTWETFVNGEKWFYSDFDLVAFNPSDYTDTESAAFISRLLQSATKLNPGFCDGGFTYHITSYIDYDIYWGLGSSSSLISNVAWWAGVDAYELHAMVSKGSGYDIACARSDKPLLYRQDQGKRMVRAVDFHPHFHDKIYFVYLGQKKDTQKDVDKFLKNKQDYSKHIKRVSEISLQLSECASYEQFSGLIREHEHIMATVLGDIPIKQKLFNDFRGEVKSLGAWGGDFAMVLWPDQKKDLLSYLSEKNINVVFGLNEMRYEYEF